jgi:hypoxanthine phosphoribosyltransferase
MHHEAGTLLISRSRIAARVAELGEAVTREITSEAGIIGEPRIVLAPILTGAMVFAADLIRHIPLKMSIRAMTASSYPGRSMQSQGVQLQGDVPTDLGGAHVLVVDDILDSGRTLGLIRRMITAQRPASLRLAVLLKKIKPDGRDEEVPIDYAGFEIDDQFVVGYGLDYDGYYRNLPDIMTLNRWHASGAPVSAQARAGG